MASIVPPQPAGGKDRREREDERSVLPPAKAGSGIAGQEAEQLEQQTRQGEQTQQRDCPAQHLPDPNRKPGSRQHAAGPLGEPVEIAVETFPSVVSCAVSHYS